MFNKWIIGGVAFLIVLSVACVLWYQHDTAADRQAAADAEKLLRQWELSQETDTDSEAEQAADVSMESETPTAEKPVTEKPVTETPDRGTEETEVEIQAQTDAETQAENAEATDVPVSPYGFGPYPEVPEDYPSKDLVKWPARSPKAELLSRVLIKLWTEGEKNFLGGGTYRGKVYPWYHNTIYVRFSSYKNADGEIVRQANIKMSSPSVDWSAVKDWSNPPPHIRILELDSSGIDPYQYLDLP